MTRSQLLDAPELPPTPVPLDRNTHIQEYAALISKMGTNESWAYSFVGLYFAFIASLGTAAGFILFKLMEQDRPIGSSLPEGFIPLGINQIGFLQSVLLLICVIAIVLNLWAIGIGAEYISTTRITLARMKRIELDLALPNIPEDGFATNLAKVNKRPIWGVVKWLVAWAIPAIFSLPWILLFREVWIHMG